MTVVQTYFLALAAVAPTALTVALVAAAKFDSARSATCLAALFMVSKAEVAEAIADLTAETATSEPVSYTHLDVYKRQTPSFSIATRKWRRRFS